MIWGREITEKKILPFHLGLCPNRDEKTKAVMNNLSQHSSFSLLQT